MNGPERLITSNLPFSKWESIFKDPMTTAAAIDRLPPYAPDLNPVEHVWNHTKYGDLANYIPDNLLDLEIEAEMPLDDLRTNPDLFRSCFHGTKLELWPFTFTMRRAVVLCALCGVSRPGPG